LQQMIAPRTRGRVYLQSFMDALITFSTFWAYLFLFLLVRPGDSHFQLDSLGAALFYSLTALAAVVAQGFKTIYSHPQFWSPHWEQSHRLSLNQVIWVALTLCVAIVAIGDFTSSRLFLFSWLGVLYLSLLLTNRFLPRKIIEAVFEGRHERIVIMGQTQSIEPLASWREYQEKSGAEIFEYLPDFSIADMANLERMMTDRHVTQLILMELPELKFNLQHVLEVCDRVGAKALLWNNLADLFRHKLETSNEHGLQLIGLKVEPLEQAHNRFLKRVVDLVGALFFILIMWPAFALICLVHKILSLGPLFLFEPRVGLKGDFFRIIKLRTTNTDGSPSSFGRMLCRTALDEWPQLINVLKGEMSLVGPRAHWPEQNEDFARVLRNYYLRSDVKPGITGLAQVRGFRGRPHSDVEIERRVRADAEYVENWSLSLDLVILIRTLFQLRPRKSAEREDHV
jgi:lipopolysaccharide/colanic/teichoic acid biosynthesis glycosyltransferase